MRRQRNQARRTHRKEGSEDYEIVSLADRVAERQPVRVAEIRLSGGDLEHRLRRVGAARQILEAYARIRDVVPLESDPQVGVLDVRNPTEGHGEFVSAAAAATRRQESGSRRHRRELHEAAAAQPDRIRSCSFLSTPAHCHHIRICCPLGYAGATG